MSGAISSAARAMERRPPSSTGATRATTRSEPHHGPTSTAPPRVAPSRAAVMALACTMGMASPLAIMNTTAKTPPSTGRRSPRAM